MGLTLPLQAEMSPDDITKFTLKNGMTIMVMEDHSIPNANMYIFWKVGSRNEYPGTTGLAHFFEHMMFNGAKKYGPKMFDQTMEANGGANNAYTSENLTVYTDWFPADAIEVMFDLEADRIQHLALDPEIVESERGVVTSERSTGLENSNFRTIWEEVKNAAFRAHPYSWPVIGHASDIENWTMDDLKSFHKTFYAPNNAVTVIVGAVDTEEVKRLAEKYFEPIPAQEPPRKIHTVEPEQKGERRVYTQKPSVTSANIMMGFHMPPNSHEDYYPLQLLSDILSSGNSSRLVRALVFEQQVADSISTFAFDSFDPNLFYVYGVASQSADAETLEKAIIAELNAVAKEGITEKELQKVKNQRLVNFYRDIGTINNRADMLGRYELFHGDYKKMFSAPQDFEKVTAEDIQRVAKTYLIKRNRTVGILDSKEDSHENDL
ncbi:insulinase family protein [Planctobacterium marinum]|nr:pitrilysin family protein [Planctobacterium marinum]MCC2604818.1 insulinase family protein [Planctobacterium marinum]